VLVGRLPRLLSIAIACTVTACIPAGCSSGSAGSRSQRSSHGGLTFTIRSGWQSVPLVNLPGAEVALQIASSKVRGGVGTICDPHRIISQIPAGGALVQVLGESGVRRHGPGAVSQITDPGGYPPLRKPFHLGAPQSQECGESYRTSLFRIGRRVFGLRIWTAPTGASSTVRGQVEHLVNSLGVESGAANASQ
jgi:hypothetical protein